MRCISCNHDIDPIRLEILPDTKLCKPCVQKHEPTVVTPPRPVALDPQPYIDAKVPPVRQFERSFVVKKSKKKKTIPQNTTPTYTQIGGLTSTDKRKVSTKTVTKVPVEFRSHGKTNHYQYRIQTFRDTFKVNTKDIQTAVAAGYTFYVENGILYLNRHGKKPNVRIGDYKKRKAK